MPTIGQRLLQFAGHLPLPGVRGIVYRLHRFLKISQSGEFEVEFGGLKYRGRLDDHIDWNVFYYGNYSPLELNFLTVAATRLEKTGGVTYFDVGANVGHHALFMSRHVKQVVAFEPSRTVLDRFEENIVLNGLKNIRVYPVALGDKDGNAQLGTGFAGNSGSRSLTWTLDKKNGLETVDVRWGDRLFCIDNLPRLDLLKLDVEGYEKRVLVGLAKTLRRDRPVVLMELIGQTEKGGFRDFADLDAVLYPRHRLFSLKGHARAKLFPFDWKEESMVCLPEECVAAFRNIMSE
jgi:FkbM family methyltransferase